MVFLKLTNLCHQTDLVGARFYPLCMLDRAAVQDAQYIKTCCFLTFKYKLYKRNLENVQEAIPILKRGKQTF